MIWFDFGCGQVRQQTNLGHKISMVTCSMNVLKRDGVSLDHSDSSVDIGHTIRTIDFVNNNYNINHCLVSTRILLIFSTSGAPSWCTWLLTTTCCHYKKHRVVSDAEKTNAMVAIVLRTENKHRDKSFSKRRRKQELFTGSTSRGVPCLLAWTMHDVQPLSVWSSTLDS